ncbi:DUF3891 family protein [Maribacter sp. 2307UL18-2]|uniref:DUF3891 family protein n=1 Tax=Maribacter sp. 2307UL18-2 TaxID=3386274 RepID=UPI0039BCCF38
MIIRKSEKGLHIVYQASHGLLAGKIAQELKKEYRPKLWLDTLVAVVEHDDHQLDFDEKNYLSDLGMPLDFTEDTVSTTKVLKRAKRVIGQAKSKSLWMALLVSFHLEFLYGHLREESQGAKTFLDDQTKFRNDTMSHLGMGKKEAENAYELLRFCDRCSLILCKDEIPDSGRKIEINTSIENKTYFLLRKENACLTVEPWCFETNEFEVSIEETIIEQTKFKNQEEFKKVLEATERSRLIWKFKL